MYKKYPGLLIEILLVGIIISIAIYVGFSSPQTLSHPLHGDLVETSNAVYNIHNRIPYEINGKDQWPDERQHYFYVNCLYYYFCSLFWNNAGDFIHNFILPNVLILISTYIIIYLFVRKFYGTTISLLAIFLMSLSAHWYNYCARLFDGAWLALPGISFLIYWLYLEFNTSGKLKYMVYIGIIVGFAFYFTTWPLLIIVIPSLTALTLLPCFKNHFRKKFAGLCLTLTIIALLIAIKEILFLATGLRYKGDPSGIKTFIDIYFIGRFYKDGYMENFSLASFLSHLVFNFKELGRIFFYPGEDCIAVLSCMKKTPFAIPLLSPLALLTAIPGFWSMLKGRKHLANYFLPVCFFFILALTTLVFRPLGKYLLPIWPIPYIASGYFIANTYTALKNSIMQKHIFTLLLLCGLAANLYQTHYYMDRILPAYSKFEYNCYSNLEWPLAELKAFLRERKKEYDVIVIPMLGQHHISYLRIWRDFVHLEKESYGTVILPYPYLWLTIDTARKGFRDLDVLIIANNFNQLQDDDICPPCDKWRVIYDKDAFTTTKIQALFPYAKLIRYVGNKQYPRLLAIFEINSDITK